MNLFQLVLKQMRQRSLSTWLTMLSVVLGVALAVAVMILQREGRALFGQTEYGYQLLVGPKGSPLQLTLNTVYQLDKSPGNIPYALYEQLITSPQYRPLVKVAVPYAVGDSYKGQRIIGTLPQLFGHDDEGNKLGPDASVMEYRPGKRYEIAQGRVFHPKKFEAVIGSEVTKLTGLKLGDKFKATHGLPAENQKPDEHEELWEVVGVLAPTHTAADKNLFIPLITFYTIMEHEEALAAHAAIRAGEDPNKATAPPKLALPKMPPEAYATTGPATTQAAEDHHDEEHHDHNYHVNPDGTIDLHLPKDQWEVSVILVRTRSPFAVRSLQYTFNNGPEAMAINPAEEMTTFFRVFLQPSSNVLLLVSLLVTIVATVAILVSIYNSVSARLREIAILRALGATRQRILAIICLEAGLIGLVGGIIGLAVGHLLGAAGSIYTQRVVGEPINWVKVSGYEWFFLLGVTIVAVLAGLVPAMKAYRTPVATNLVAG
jgi:putative ABC transport system permease protein